MKKAKFWVDWLLEAGEENVCHRYGFGVELSDEEFEELYQVWFGNNSQLNSWESDWKGYDALFDRLNNTAYHTLNSMLKENEPEHYDPVNVYWEISKETADTF